MKSKITIQYFRHLDGGIYRFVEYARSADTDGDVVIYEHLWPFEQSLWVRNRADFESRFTPVDEVTVKRAFKQERVAAQAQVNAAKAARRAAPVLSPVVGES
jgi:hypothetical protein